MRCRSWEAVRGQRNGVGHRAFDVGESTFHFGEVDLMA